MKIYEPVIGLEVHVQLNTQTKLFSRVPYQYGAAPNTLTDPVILALPGTLPKINQEAIHKTLQVGLAFHCKIPPVSRWDRKHYFYPDTPKNYQISQKDFPLCRDGKVEIELRGPSRNIMGQHRFVKLNRIHLEEDVGKLTHAKGESYVDYNRAGVCLIEIVTEPDLFSSDEVFAFLKSLRTHLLYLNVSDADMEKGQLRCDANISLRKKGTSLLGTKVELKNLNSISGVCKGIDYEIQRQTEVLEQGDSLLQETRRWDADQEKTFSMRAKESVKEYFYFPDPDLKPINISKNTLEAIQSQLPEIPFEKQNRFLDQYQLPYTITSVLCPNPKLCRFFEATVALYHSPKTIANWIVNDLLSYLGDCKTEKSLDLSNLKIQPQHLAELVENIENNVISNTIAKEIFLEMLQSGTRPSKLIQQKGVIQNNDLEFLRKLCQKAIAENPKAVAEFKAGKIQVLNALKGPIMKASQGKANPVLIDQIFKELLTKRQDP